MTLELMAIIAATISLGGLILTQSRAAARERADLRESTAREFAELRESMARLEVSLTERIARVEVSLTERIARVEGTLDVVRDDVAGRRSGDYKVAEG